MPQFSPRDKRNDSEKAREIEARKRDVHNILTKKPNGKARSDLELSKSVDLGMATTNQSQQGSGSMMGGMNQQQQQQLLAQMMHMNPVMSNTMAGMNQQMYPQMMNQGMAQMNEMNQLYPQMMNQGMTPMMGNPMAGNMANNNPMAGNMAGRSMGGAPGNIYG